MLSLIFLIFFMIIYYLYEKIINITIIIIQKEVKFMTKRTIVAAHISDIHFGAMDGEQLYREMKNEFIGTLKKLPVLDVIFIQGDLTHYELGLNSRHAYYMLKTFEKIVKFAKKRNVAIRVIKGTKSHDHDQLDVLTTFSNEVDIKVIRTVQVEEFNGAKILYIPEEYMKDPDSYYAEYFDDTYDYIIGHGMMEEESFHNNNNQLHLSDAPVFNTKQLSSIGHVICFGHIHNAHVWNDVYYTGSFSRWQFGEEEPKGFLISLFDKETKKKVILPIINKMARKYSDFIIDKYVETLDVELIIDLIESRYIDNKIYKMRVIVNEKKDSEYMGKVAIIQNHFTYNRLIEIVIKNSKLKADEEDEIGLEIEEKYKYLFDDNLNPTQKISLFIKNEKGYELSPEKVEELINTDILKLLENLLEE